MCIKLNLSWWKMQLVYYCSLINRLVSASGNIFAYTRFPLVTYSLIYNTIFYIVTYYSQMRHYMTIFHNTQKQQNLYRNVVRKEMSFMHKMYTPLSLRKRIIHKISRFIRKSHISTMIWVMKIARVN